LGYYIIGYRKEVIFSNLRNSFPKKSEVEITRLAKSYFAFMIDMIFETFKMLVISERELRKRFVYTNMELMDEFAKQNKSVILVLGHLGNWEWFGHSMQFYGKHQTDFLYHPLSNAFFEWLTLHHRTRFGVYPIPMKVSIREMMQRKELLTGTAFITDQTPSNTETALWLRFLNQDTSVFLGSEKVAKKMDAPVIFVHVKRLRRGYYQGTFEVITEHPKQCEDNWITEQHTLLLEKDIIANPEIWLWSHRRWKHKKPANV
jgi:KDO2-lipid IV(A) lauroyltransferase